MGITQSYLAKEVGISQDWISEIIAGQRSITVDIGLRLSKFFSMSEGFWIGLQVDYDAALAKDQLHQVLSAIKPWQAHINDITST